MKKTALALFAGAALLSFIEGVAGAAPRLRARVTQAGDFVLIGNTLGHECRKSTPAPVVGTVGSCATTGDTSTLPDSAPDIFWRADSPSAGGAEADVAITRDAARSTAMLVLPSGAEVTHAFLYWSARNAQGADGTATVDREGGFSADLTAVESWEVTVNQGTPDESHVYQSVADVTALVQANGAGEYRVSGVEVSDIVDVDDARTYVGWWMVVLYEAPEHPERDLAIFDGMDRVSRSNPQVFALDGVKVPDGGFDAKLGVVAFEGDNNISGDRLFINPSSSSPSGDEALGDGQSPPENFFNGTRSLLGAPVSVAGDLPQLTGTPQSYPGIDIDVVDVTSRLAPGQTSIPVMATSDGDEAEADLYFIGGWVTSIGGAPGLYPTGSGVFLCAAGPGDRDAGAAWLLGAAAAAGAGLRLRRRPRR